MLIIACNGFPPDVWSVSVLSLYPNLFFNKNIEKVADLASPDIVSFMMLDSIQASVRLIASETRLLPLNLLVISDHHSGYNLNSDKTVTIAKALLTSIKEIIFSSISRTVSSVHFSANVFPLILIFNSFFNYLHRFFFQYLIWSDPQYSPS